MIKLISFLGLVILSFPTWAEDKDAFVQGAAQGPMYVYQAEDDFDMLKEGVEVAITNLGLRVSGTLHVSEMLNRTGKDLGFEKKIYTKAESVEFCSAMISHKMTQTNPLNLGICPFTIALFIKPAEPETVYVSFRKIFLAGDNPALVTEIENMLHGIVREALDLE